MILLYLFLSFLAFYALASLILLIFFPSIAKGAILAPVTFLTMIYCLWRLPKGKL
jgi:hypothetical protein